MCGCPSPNNPDSKVHGANMGPTWVLSAPDRPYVGPMNLAIREGLFFFLMKKEFFLDNRCALLSNDNCSETVEEQKTFQQSETWKSWMKLSLLWRHNEPDGVSNHQPHGCLLNRLFGHRSKKTSKLRVTGLCAGNSSKTGEFPAQMASNAENVSIWWHHHGCLWQPQFAHDNPTVIRYIMVVV